MGALVKLSDTNHIPPEHSLQWHNVQQHKVKDLLYGKEKNSTLLAPAIGKLLKKKLVFFFLDYLCSFPGTWAVTVCWCDPGTGGHGANIA